MRNRVRLERVDNEGRRYDIEVAREMLFEKGINISSVKIDRVLGPTSAVPTRVCIYRCTGPNNILSSEFL